MVKGLEALDTIKFPVHILLPFLQSFHNILADLIRITGRENENHIPGLKVSKKVQGYIG
jgi:hypothetical protein